MKKPERWMKRERKKMCWLEGRRDLLYQENKKERKRSFRFSLRHATLHPSCIIDRPSLSHFREDTFPPLFIHLLASSHHSAEHETADKNKGDGQDGAVKETKGPRAGHDDDDDTR